MGKAGDHEPDAPGPGHRPLVYVSGPYARPDPLVNANHAIRLAERLFNSGLVVPLIPHLSMMWQAIHPRPDPDWMDYRLELLVRCDATIAFGAPCSTADAELACARHHEIPVFHRVRDLLNWARTTPPPRRAG